MTTFSQTADITQGCVPLEVQFTPPGGSTTHFWDFGDGATAQLASPTNTFINPGTYTVEYSNSPGGSVVGTVTIEVYSKPVPTFTADPASGCSPLAVQFTNTTQLNPGITITGYSWVYGDGGQGSGASPSHTFVGQGSYFVSLGITTNLVTCNVTQVYEDHITVGQSPQASFTTSPSPATACEPPLTVTFTNFSTTGAGITYAWDFGNGATSTDQSPGQQTYTSNGDFVVTLQVTNAEGCTSQVQRTVSIGQPTSEFTAPADVCLGAQVPMVNESSAGNYLWTFSSGVALAGGSPTSANPVMTFTTGGQQTITLQTTSANGQCTSSVTHTVNVQEPSAEFTSTPDFFCELPMNVSFSPDNSGYASYEWLFGDSTTSTAVSPVHTYINEDTTIYSWNSETVLPTTLVVTTDIGCTDTVVHADTVWLPNAVFFPDKNDGCAPLTVTFSDSSTAHENIVEWEWHMGDGTVVTANDNSPQSVTYTQPGHFATYLVITNASGCKDTSYLVITEVGTQVTPIFSVDKTDICPGETVQFSNQTAESDSVDAWHFYGEDYHQFHCWDVAEPTWTFENVTGQLDVTLVAGFNGCYSSTTLSDLITVNGPIAEIFHSYDCADPYTVTFENRSQDFTDILWDFGDGNTSTDQDPVHTYADRGDYTVTLTVNGACPTSVDVVTVRIREIKAQFASDTILCSGISNTFDAALSQDVHGYCYSGYTWLFSDPDMRPITTDSPSLPLAFPQTGEMEITLIVEDIHGCKDTASTNVDLYSVEVTIAASDSPVCSGQEVTFTNTTVADTTIDGYSWWILDGFPPTNLSGSTVTHTFSQSGGGSVAVIVLATDDVGCVGADTLMVPMYQINSNITIDPNTTNICAGTELEFTATDFGGGGSSLDFEWTITGETGTQSGQTITHTFDNGGMYSVVANFTEQGSGCTGTVSRNITVQDYPVAGFTFDADPTGIICRPQNVIFTNTTTAAAGTSYTWNLGNGTTGSNPTTLATVYTQSGELTATITATTSFGCSDTYSQDFLVVGPQGDFVVDINTICRNEEITFTIIDTAEVYTYTWDFGDGSQVDDVSPVTHQYTFVPPSGVTTAKLIVSSVNGACPVQVSQQINIHEVVALFERNDGLDTAICFQPYAFTNQSLNSDVFYWNFGDGTTSTTEQPGEHVYAQPGTYIVTLGVLNNTLGCNDTIIKEVILHPIPDITAQGDTVCEGTVASLNVTDVITPADYLWTQAEGEPIADVTQPNTTTQPLLTTAYTVQVTDANGCINSDSAIVVVVNPLELNDFDTAIVIGDIINLPFDADPNVYNIVWTPAEGLSCADCPLPELQPLEDVVYELQVTDVLDCFSADATYTVIIHPETFIKLPTTFTPNEDGNNDIIYVEGWGIKELYEFQVYNRWGEMVFESNDKAIGWDGYYNGVLQNNDVYVYKVRALTWRDEEQTQEGYINLMR